MQGAYICLIKLFVGTKASLISFFFLIKWKVDVFNHPHALLIYMLLWLPAIVHYHSCGQITFFSNAGFILSPDFEL